MKQPDLPPPPPPRRERRSLSHVGGAIRFVGGTDRERQALERALRVSAAEDRVMRHVHGFHSYPARLHPDTAAALIEGLSDEGDRVLDPFCGSGTVLVEGRLRGRALYGSDANPLAIALARLKVNGLSDKALAELRGATERVATDADERRKSKAGPTRMYPREDLVQYDTHMLLELDGLRAGIERLPTAELRGALGLVLSSIMTKTSKRPGDTVRGTEPRRLPTGFAIRAFVRKAAELEARLSEYAALVPPGCPPARVEVADARELPFRRPHTVRLVVTSPPYPGVYDYHQQHETRIRWLGLDGGAFERTEIGARRHGRTRRTATEADSAGARARWEAQFGAVLAELGRSLHRSGVAVLVLADSVLGQRALRNDALIDALAPAAGLEVACVASQPRPWFHKPTARAFADSPRMEHAIVLRRPGTAATTGPVAAPPAAPPAPTEGRGGAGSRRALRPRS